MLEVEKPGDLIAHVGKAPQATGADRIHEEHQAHVTVIAIEVIAQGLVLRVEDGDAQRSSGRGCCSGRRGSHAALRIEQ